MLEFVIQPLVGFGPIRFGQTRDKVNAILASMGQTEAVRRNPQTDCYFQNAFQVSYDIDERVEFIEAGRSNEFSVVFHGRPLHEMVADDAVRFVSQFAEHDKDHPEHGCSFIFPALQLSLWRQVLPEGPDDPDGQFFDAIGLGKQHYF